MKELNKLLAATIEEGEDLETTEWTWLDLLAHRTNILPLTKSVTMVSDLDKENDELVEEI